MKKFLLAALAALVCYAAPSPSTAAPVATTGATSRVMVYYTQNPDTNELNIEWRFQRLEIGTVMRDLLGSLATTGAWSNLLITPGSGLYVTVNPRNSAQLGSLYQFVQDDTSALPPPPGQSPYQLPADSTRVIAQATQSSPSGAIGPLSAPGGAGNAIDYMIEAQLSSVDTSQQSVLFIPSSGIPQYQNVLTQRQDVISYQINAGSSSAADCSSTFPTPPTVDAGWTQIGLVCVAHGVTQVTTGMIAMSGGTNFNGYSFGQIQFGGNYAQDNNQPSVLTTHGGILMCGSISAFAGGFSIDNASSSNNGGHLIAGDLSGNVAFCGSTLYLYAQNATSAAPKIIVNTSEDYNSGSAYSCNDTPPCYESLSLAAGNVTMTLSPGCAPASLCGTTTSGRTICANTGVAHTAAVSWVDTTAGGASGVIGTQQSYSAPGVNIQPTNVSSNVTISNGDHLTAYYTCF